MKKAAVVLAVAGMLAFTGCMDPAVQTRIDNERAYMKLGKECFGAGGDWVSEENKPYRCNFTRKDLD